MPHNILVVDDDEGILDAVTMILSDAGYHVESAVKGDIVFEKVTQFRPDLILLDVLLSGKDGRMICKKTQERPSDGRYSSYYDLCSS